MTGQKQLKLFQAKEAFRRQARYIVEELRVCTRVDHLQPVLDFLEWLVRDMADLAGMTAEVQAHAREHVAIRSQVAQRGLHLSKPRAPTRPRLRLVK